MMEGKLNSRVIRGRVTSLPQIDPTLCKAGQAADAKATGDYLRLLSAGGGISKEIAAHIESRDNPHSVTAAHQVSSSGRSGGRQSPFGHGGSAGAGAGEQHGGCRQACEPAPAGGYCRCLR